MEDETGSESKNFRWKIFPATCNIKIMKSLARLKIEKCALDSVYIANIYTRRTSLAKDDKRVKFSLNLHDIFHRTVNAKEMKAEDSKETLRVFITMTTKRQYSSKNLNEETDRVCLSS